MIRAEQLAQLKALEKNETFMKELFMEDTPEKIQKKLETAGVQLTLDEVKELVRNTVDCAERMRNSEELSEEALDNVAGGFAVSTAVGLAIVLGMWAAGVAIGWKAAKGKC